MIRRSVQIQIHTHTHTHTQSFGLQPLYSMLERVCLLWQYPVYPQGGDKHPSVACTIHAHANYVSKANC